MSQDINERHAYEYFPVMPRLSRISAEFKKSSRLGTQHALIGDAEYTGRTAIGLQEPLLGDATRGVDNL